MGSPSLVAEQLFCLDGSGPSGGWRAPHNCVSSSPLLPGADIPPGLWALNQLSFGSQPPLFSLGLQSTKSLLFACG